MATREKGEGTKTPVKENCHLLNEVRVLIKCKRQGRNWFPTNFFLLMTDAMDFWYASKKQHGEFCCLSDWSGYDCIFLLFGVLVARGVHRLHPGSGWGEGGVQCRTWSPGGVHPAWGEGTHHPEVCGYAHGLCGRPGFLTPGTRRLRQAGVQQVDRGGPIQETGTVSSTFISPPQIQWPVTPRMLDPFLQFLVHLLPVACRSRSREAVGELATCFVKSLTSQNQITKKCSCLFGAEMDWISSVVKTSDSWFFFLTKTCDFRLILVGPPRLSCKKTPCSPWPHLSSRTTTLATEVSGPWREKEKLRLYGLLDVRHEAFAFGLFPKVSQLCKTWISEKTLISCCDLSQHLPTAIFFTTSCSALKCVLGKQWSLYIVLQLASGGGLLAPCTSRWICFCNCGKANNQWGRKWRVWWISIATTIKNTFTILNHKSVVAREIINCKICCSVWLQWFKQWKENTVLCLCLQIEVAETYGCSVAPGCGSGFGSGYTVIGCAFVPAWETPVYVHHSTVAATGEGVAELSSPPGDTCRRDQSAPSVTHLLP